MAIKTEVGKQNPAVGKQILYYFGTNRTCIRYEGEFEDIFLQQ